jgi:hypothetical protein
VILCIYEKSEGQDNLIEAYTFGISYQKHAGDDNLVARVMTLSIEQASKLVHHVNDIGVDISKSISKILRSVCLLTQTLTVISTC